MSADRPIRGSSGFFLTAFYVGSLVLIYLGERVVVDAATARFALAGIGGLGILIALIGRLVRAKKLSTMARPVEMSLFFCYLVGVVALCLYAGQADFALERIRPWFGDLKAAERFQTILAVIWPIAMLSTLLPIAFIEASYASMNTAKTVELARVRRSFASGVVIAMTIATVFLLNYVANETSEKVDLSYFKTTKPSATTKKMVANLSKPLRIILFFPAANEVLDHLRAYMSELAHVSPQLQVESTDHLLSPKLAKEFGVSANGTIVFSYEGKKETIRINEKFKYAKNRLKKLDTEFQSSFLKATSAPHVAYFTVGHEERERKNRGEPPAPGTGVNMLRKQLGYMNYRLKELGTSDLASSVPADATIVLIIGPQKPFLPAEIDSLKRYLEGGGNVMLFLDPDDEPTLDDLLLPYGIRFIPQPLAHETKFARETYAKADRYNILTNQYSAHPSVTTLSKNSKKVATVLLKSGWLEQAAPTAKDLKPKTQITLRSLASTFTDTNGNYLFDQASEKRSVFNLAAVITAPVGKPSKDAKSDQAKELKMLVVADSNIVADKVFSFPGNAYFFVDALKWMVGEEEYIGETSSEEDVKIRHTRKDDQLWFHITIFGAPLLVLGLGILYTRFRRRRRVS